MVAAPSPRLCWEGSAAICRGSADLYSLVSRLRYASGLSGCNDATFCLSRVALGPAHAAGAGDRELSGAGHTHNQGRLRCALGDVKAFDRNEGVSALHNGLLALCRVLGDQPRSGVKINTPAGMWPESYGANPRGRNARTRLAPTRDRQSANSTGMKP